MCSRCNFTEWVANDWLDSALSKPHLPNSTWDNAQCALFGRGSECYTCVTTHHESYASVLLYRYVFPVILLVGLLGNCCSVLLYRHRYLSGSCTVRLLLFKSVVNNVHLLGLLPVRLYYNEHYTQPEECAMMLRWDDWNAALYWHLLKYLLFTCNSASTLAAWLTVGVTFEHVSLIVWPIAARSFSQKSTANWCALLIGLLSILLHSYQLAAFHTITRQCCANLQFVAYRFRDNKLFPAVMTQSYYMLSNAFMIILPLVGLLVLSAMLCAKLYCARSNTARSAASEALTGLNRRKASTVRRNEQKKCIASLALCTAACHLLLEVPHMVLLLGVSLHGSAHQDLPEFTNWLTAVANVLSMTHAALPFFVYVATSRRFRQIFIVVFVHPLGFEILPQAELASLELRRTNQASSRHTTCR